ncbi:Hypothetical predicted protein [Mytilus galloprovincialis]|uniref:SUEL-type lectin domain-containing protein n=1 Tax=Mytilus galloprovincialis TaxID=29158 RepID=A0A8B6DV05_MYTGA|nr:Hypothetical predicted protein [Mytilus galloprovincialis]
MGNITFNILGLSIALVSLADKSHGLYFEYLLCENHEAKFNCSVGNSIDDINITSHDVQDACRTTDYFQNGTVITLDSMSYQSCIGNNSCVLKDEMFNVPHSVLDKTWKLFVKFVCIRIRDNDTYEKPALSLSPFNMKSVNCTHSDRRMEIHSVELKQNSSFCEKQNLHESLTKCIQMKVNAACNGKQTCEQVRWYEPKYVNISFSCKGIQNELQSQTESYVGAAVGVTVGLIIIVGGVVVFIWFVRRKKPDDKKYMAHHHENTDMSDNIGNQNIALSATCNSEIPSNIELSNVNSKQNNYEMAKPMNMMNESEKDNYVFHENQYDVSRGNNCSEPQQGIYSRAVDTVYDSASHSRQNNISDQTYDHAFGPTTEDNYDITKK